VELSDDPMKKPPHRGRFRWLKRVLASMLVLILGAAAAFGIWWYIVSSTTASELQEATAKANQVEPVLEIAELEARRQSVPEEENSALKVSAAAKLLPAGIADGSLIQRVHAVAPNRPLDESLKGALEQDLKKGKAGVEALLCLETMPRGGCSIRWSEPDPTAADFAKYSLVAAKAAKLLAFEATVRAERADGYAALAACRAAFNAGRSIGDEPTLIAQLVRIALTLTAIDSIERALAQCTAGDEGIRQTQLLLQDEADCPISSIAIRGESALFHTIASRQESGAMPISELASYSDPSISDEFNSQFKFLNYARLRRSHASMLINTSDLLKIVRRPCHEWRSAVDQLVTANNQAPALARSQLRALAQIPDAACRRQALIQSAFAGLALERHRLAIGRWPDSLEELCPKYLRDPPLDPYNGRPLLYRHLPDGVVVYSVGPDGQDNGGKMDRQNRRAPGTDVGFQLWDLDKRGQAAAKNDP
jgi:hypothetical protein